MRQRTILILCVFSLLIATVSTPPAVGADNNYTLSLETSIETPTRTVSIGGENHTVSAVGRTAPDNQFPVTVAAPSDTGYDVLLYNADRQIVASKEGRGDQTAAFNLTGYTPGSYLLVVYKDGDYKDVYPVVVRGYTVAVEAPSRAATDSKITISVTTERTEGSVEDPSSIEVILANEEETVRVTATNEGGQTYRATVSLKPFQAGDIRVYAGVQGPDDAFKKGQKELLGISDASVLTVYQRTTQTTTESPKTPEPTETTAATSTRTSTMTVTTTATPTLTTSTVRTSSLESTETTLHSTRRPSTTEPNNSDVITPNQVTATTSMTADRGIPGFGATVALVALGCLLILVHRR